jgi:hypothetical protein
VTADRSYGEKSIEDDLRALGVRHVVTQTAMRLGPHPPGRHRRSQNLGRYGILAHNLVKISTLAS